MKIYSTHLGERLRQRRHHLEMKQWELALKADLSQGFVCDLESGKKVPSLATLEALACALETDVASLLGEEVTS